MRNTKKSDRVKNTGLFLVPTVVPACGTEHPRLLCSTLYMLPQLNSIEKQTVEILRENAAAFGSL